MITDEDKERVREATDVVALVGETVVLRQRGNDYWGCCPFHEEKSPSFHVNASTGLWKCFGCQKGGDIFDYVREREGLEFPDAVRYLADRANIELTEERMRPNRGPKRSRVMEALAEAESYYRTILLRGKGAGPDGARRYLSGRGFGTKVCRSWNVGYAPGRGLLVAHLKSKGFSDAEIVKADLGVDRSGRVADRFFERVMFPIHDERGRAVGFGGRVLSDAKPKYLNTRETSVFHKSRNLFGLDRARETITATGLALVVEGYTDVIALHEAGYTNAVAALGTALTFEHMKTLARYRTKVVVFMFDGDAAGQRAAEACVRYVGQTPADLRCVVLPDGQDPMEFLSTHASDDLRPHLEAAEPLMDFVMGKKVARFDLTVPGQRVAALDALAQTLAPLKESVLLDRYATQVADLVGADVAEVRRRIRTAPQPDLEEGGSRQGGGRAQRSGYVQGGTVVPGDARPAPGHASNDQALQPQGQVAEGGIGAAVPLSAISTDVRMQLVAERELLALMAAEPDAVRSYGPRLAGVVWEDARDESMAWAMLATPQGTSPARVVAAAASVVDEAPQLLSGGRIEAISDMDAERKASFLVDVVELWSCRRRVREIKGRLGSLGSTIPDEEARKLFAEATELQRRANELQARVSNAGS